MSERRAAVVRPSRPRLLGLTACLLALGGTVAAVHLQPGEPARFAVHGDAEPTLDRLLRFATTALRR
ncbi:MAG: hypothetical protein QOH43_131 [Solirubrobacteraceae bacterium]|nr:hypothetical protein [Solirubrobacteraceae bacterium]